MALLPEFDPSLIHISRALQCTFVVNMNDIVMFDTIGV